MVVTMDASFDSSLLMCTVIAALLDTMETLRGAVSFCGRAGSATVTGWQVNALFAQVYCSRPQALHHKMCRRNAFNVGGLFDTLHSRESFRML